MCAQKDTAGWALSCIRFYTNGETTGYVLFTENYTAELQNYFYLLKSNLFLIKIFATMV